MKIVKSAIGFKCGSAGRISVCANCRFLPICTLAKPSFLDSEFKHSVSLEGFDGNFASWLESDFGKESLEYFDKTLLNATKDIK